MAAQALEAREVAAVDTPPLDLDDQDAVWRYSRWLEQGFTAEQAERLAMTRDGAGAWLSASDVRERYLKRGCDHALAFDLVT